MPTTTFVIGALLTSSVFGYVCGFGFGWVLGHKILIVKRFAELSS